MPFRLRPISRSSASWWISSVLLVFAVSGIVRYRRTAGDDLASSFVACRLIASRQAAHLYSYDPVDFAAVGADGPDNQWQARADEGGFEGFLHPYVQTPLWAYSLLPLCTRTRYPVFEDVFLVLTMASFAGFIWLAVRFWAPKLYHPLIVAGLCLGVWFSSPFQYAMMLMQTHILLMVLTLGSLILAERRRPVLAGLLLAIAAAVKVTPAVLLVYWLLTRRSRAALSMVAWSVALLSLTILTTGHAVMLAYLADLHRISGILLVSQNNQSFAAWVMGHLYPSAEFAKVRILPLPASVRGLSTFLMVGFTVLGGWLDRRAEPFQQSGHVGAAMALVSATVFAPIAWTHYSFILIVPLVVLGHENLRLRSAALFLLLGCAAALNFRPLASDVETMEVGRFAVVRGQFLAGVLCLFALLLATWMKRRVRRQRMAAWETSVDEDLSFAASKIA